MGPSPRRPVRLLVATVLPVAALLLAAPAAQEPYLHLNPVVEKLSQGRHVFGVSTADLSLQNARSLARVPDIDYVYVDMEHNPLRFDALEQFVAFLTAADKAGIAARGNLQAHPAVFARFPPYGREQTEWMVKHALDIGLMGILINNIETVEQAEQIVETIRPRQRADLWPLNPQGDLLFWPMIETQVGVDNADAIARVPGVGGFYLGAGGDLSAAYGVESAEHPDVEAAFEQILAVCRARDLACGGTVNPDNAARRLAQGYRIFNFGGANGGLTAGNAATRDAVVAAGAAR